MNDRALKPLPRGLAGVVLAAGAAARFGGPKQLARLDGEALVVRALRLAIAHCPCGVTLVTGARSEEVRREVAAVLPDERVRLVYNVDWQSGMASSIRCGLIHPEPAAIAVLVLLCDQPAVTAADVRRLVTAWEAVPTRMAAARYAGGPGAPAIFPRSEWPALMALAGDQGARSLLRSTAAITAVDIPGAAHDVNTPADLTTLMPPE